MVHQNGPNKLGGLRKTFDIPKPYTQDKRKESYSKNVTRNGLLQQWLRIVDENSFEHRLSSGKCKGFVPFTAYGTVCSLCKHQSDVISPDPCSKEPLDKLSMLKAIFPGCSELMLKVLTVQCNICNEPGKDPRSRRWDKEIVQVCLTL